MVVVVWAILAQQEPSQASPLQDVAAWAAILTFIGLAFGGLIRGGWWLWHRWDARPYLALDFKSVAKTTETALPATLRAKRGVHLSTWVVEFHWPSGFLMGEDHASVKAPQPDWTHQGLTYFPKGTTWQLKCTIKAPKPIEGWIYLIGYVGDGTTVTAKRKLRVIE